jgi:ubiquinone/menaquinone biosynthesis C-methylase UbiE
LACGYYGDSIHSVGWFSRETQIKRFEILCEIFGTREADLSGQTVLDLGCGLGDLYEFLQQNKLALDYTGIDVSKKMLRIAQKKYPKVKFAQADFLSDNFTDTYDYILCSGAFNLKMENGLTYLRSTIKKMINQAKKGVAFNLLSALHVPAHEQDRLTFNYYYPEDIQKICEEMVSQVVIKIGYLPNDFTVYIHLTPG